MKKLLLCGALAAAATLSLKAENKLYYDAEHRAEARCVSSEGKYAVFTDPDNLVSYIWDASKPEEFNACRCGHPG